MGEALVKTANRAGGPDNVTVVVVRLEPGEQEVSGTASNPVEENPPQDS
jgi:serine/threonine protein phosphatase PrpC